MNGRFDPRRRALLQGLSLAALASGLGIPTALRAQSCPTVNLPRTLVNVMLQGGADLRFLIMPRPDHPDPGYLDALWTARRDLYTEDYGGYTAMFEAEYLPVAGQGFGIYRRCGWLHGEFEAGRVAIVANAVCSENRRHDQSILNADAGVPDLEVLNFDRDGWGGRLNEQLPGATNVVELGSSISTFGKGTTPNERLGRVIHAQDTRDIALASPDGGNPQSRRNVMARALGAYYRGRAPEVAAEKPADWPYHVLFQHHAALEAVGADVDARLGACGPLPESLSALQLYETSFAQQCRNLHDVCQLGDVLEGRVLSMNYGGWDTHVNQAGDIGDNLADLFGNDGGLATAFAAIDDLPFGNRPPRDQLALYFASDFGRQLAANGSGGTDHGSGTYALLVGSPLRGGVYGDLFPARENQPDPEGRVPLQTEGADIAGQTSTERLLAAACEWMQPGSGAVVMPGAAQSVIEPGVDLAGLFRA